MVINTAVVTKRLFVLISPVICIFNFTVAINLNLNLNLDLDLVLDLSI